MQKSLKTLAYLSFLALPLLAASPVLAETPPSDQLIAVPTGAPAQKSKKQKACDCPYMTENPRPMGMGMGMGPYGGMGGPEGIPMDIMFPQGQETPEMTQVRNEIQVQHQKIQADHKRMHELMQQLKEMRAQAKKPKASRGKGNSAPASPVAD